MIKMLKQLITLVQSYQKQQENNISKVFIAHFKKTPYIVLVFLLINLNILSFAE